MVFCFSVLMIANLCFEILFILNYNKRLANTFVLKLGQVNIRLITAKVIILNEIITDLRFTVLNLKETWIIPPGCTPSPHYIQYWCI